MSEADVKDGPAPVGAMATAVSGARDGVQESEPVAPPETSVGLMKEGVATVPCARVEMEPSDGTR